MSKKKSQKQRERYLTLKERRLALNAFQKYDLDGSGNIDAKEMATILADLGISQDDDLIQSVLENADIDNDGSVDFEEFLQFYKVCLAEADYRSGTNMMKLWDQLPEKNPPLTRTTRLTALPGTEAFSSIMETDVDYILQPRLLRWSRNQISESALLMRDLEKGLSFISEDFSHLPVINCPVISTNAYCNGSWQETPPQILQCGLEEDDLSDSDTDSEDEHGLPMAKNDVLLTPALCRTFFDEVTVESLDDEFAFNANIRSAGSVYGQNGVPEEVRASQNVQLSEQIEEMEKQWAENDAGECISNNRKIVMDRHTRSLESTIPEDKYLVALGDELVEERQKNIKWLPEKCRDLTAGVYDPRLRINLSETQG